MTPRPTLSAHFFVRRILLHCSVCVSLCTRRRNLIVIVFVFYKVTMMVFIIIILSVPLWLIFHFVRRIWNTQNTNTKNSIGFMNYSFPSRIFGFHSLPLPIAGRVASQCVCIQRIPAQWKQETHTTLDLGVLNRKSVTFVQKRNYPQFKPIFLFTDSSEPAFLSLCCPFYYLFPIDFLLNTK